MLPVQYQCTWWRTVSLANLPYHPTLSDMLLIYSCAYVGNVAAVTRLGIPPITMNDGPQGFRDDNHPGTTTAWPSVLLTRPFNLHNAGTVLSP